MSLLSNDNKRGRGEKYEISMIYNKSHPDWEVTLCRRPGRGCFSKPNPRDAVAVATLHLRVNAVKAARGLSLRRFLSDAADEAHPGDSRMLTNKMALNKKNPKNREIKSRSV